MVKASELVSTAMKVKGLAKFPIRDRELIRDRLSLPQREPLRRKRLSYLVTPSGVLKMPTSLEVNEKVWGTNSTRL
jgi:hypothetical protein